jgi:hydroxylamine reductase
MDMFCYQCQETTQGKGCTKIGVCGKTAEVANLQDLLIFTLEGIAKLNLQARKIGINQEEADRFIVEGLFSTVTNVNFDKSFFIEKIKQAVALRDQIKDNLEKAGTNLDKNDKAINWAYQSDADIEALAPQVGILVIRDDDIRSLRSLVLYGLKGMSAYDYHAYQLGYKDDSIFEFMEQALSKLLDDTLTADDYVTLVL